MGEAQSEKYLLQIKKLRREIDQADKDLLKALARRSRTIEKMARLKYEQGLAVKQKSRWAQVMKDRLAHAKKLKIDLKLIEKIFKGIQAESIDRQNKLIKAWGRDLSKSRQRQDQK